MTENIWDPEFISGIVFQAGVMAMEYQDTIQGSQKADNSLVTKADREVEAFLTEKLLEAYPHAVVLGEETAAAMTREELGRGLEGDLFIIDPIDGTAVYAAGLGGWGVSLGYARKGQLVHGAVFLPGQGEFYRTAGSRAEYARLAMDEQGRPRAPETGVIAFRPLLPRTEQPVQLVGITQYIAKDKPFPVPYTLVATASCVVSLLNTARGSFAGYIGKAKVWDMAAAWPIAHRAGVRGRMQEDNRTFGLSLTEGLWNMEPSHPRAWGLPGNVIFYRDEDLARNLRRGGSPEYA